MKSFHEMLRKVTHSPYYDQMLRFAQPLHDHLGINHFWYYRITSSGDYSYLGTHAAWSEFCFDRSLSASFPCLRHPNSLQSGISLMKSTNDAGYQQTLQTAWEKFGINFNINLQQKIPNGIEAFGFASKFDDLHADERVLNELPLLQHFINNFRNKHKKLFELLDEASVNIASHFGQIFYERQKALSLPLERKELICKMGLSWIFTLTAREKDVLHFVANGQTALSIAEALGLSVKTVENYLATIKSKLMVATKTDLIQKAREFSTLTRL